jgi:fructosamine-3-kinase
MGWARIERTVIEGRRVVTKFTDYDARLEADGLRALGAAGAPVPDVLVADAHSLTMSEVRGRPDWERLGHTLATVHQHTADRFGYPIGNVIGALPQPNAWTDSWGAFFADNRVVVHLADPAVPPDLARRLRKACDGPLIALLDQHGPVPSLVHGDLWAGNVVDGSFLIDPAVSYSDREVELAFMAVFGGVPASMWNGYLDTWPLSEGWERRRHALQLHHLLVHVRLFGGGYAGMVADRLDRLGW